MSRSWSPQKAAGVDPGFCDFFLWIRVPLLLQAVALPFLWRIVYDFSSPVV